MATRNARTAARKPRRGGLKTLSGRGWRLIVGDCRAAGGTAEPDADLAFIDPPYNQGVDYGNGKAADKRPPAEYRDWLCLRLSILLGRLRPGGALFVMLPDEWVATAAVHLSRFDVELRNWIKWSETFGTNQVRKFSRCSRHVLYFVKNGAAFTFNADAVRIESDRLKIYNDKRANPAGKVPGDVWEISRVCGTFKEREKAVPTQLPEELLDRIVRAASNPGDRVLEFCTGSGSLGRVCLRTGRKYEGWEIDPRTAAVAARRIGTAMVDKSVL